MGTRMADYDHSHIVAVGYLKQWAIDGLLAMRLGPRGRDPAPTLLPRPRLGAPFARRLWSRRSWVRVPSVTPNVPANGRLSDCRSLRHNPSGSNWGLVSR